LFPSALEAAMPPRNSRNWVEERSLVPLGEARLGRIGLDAWLRRSPARA
jgi:hypothetical protein